MSSEAPARDYDFQVVPLDDIDPPEIAMRAEMDDQKLEELAANIRVNGVLQPVGLYRVGKRTKVIYGHRRVLAARMAGERAIPARIHADGAAHEEDYKLAENRFREDVNPAAEASWLADLLERKCHGEIDRLCRLVGATESWINGRLDLLRGDSAVLEALSADKIRLSVARELNRIKDDSWRRHYLQDAIEMGASAATVQGWRINAERHAAMQAAAADPNAPAAAPSTEVPIASADTCILCVIPGDSHDMEYVRVHRSCLAVHRRHQQAGVQ